MAGAVARGSFWMISSAAATRVASFIAQILLGARLSQHDFGVYAIAISVSSLAAVLKDGGVKQVLVQRQREYDRLIGPVFWMAAAFNTATGLIIAGLAPVLARAYDEPRIALLMLVIAASQPIATPGAILATRLQIDMRFREAGMIATASAMVRYLGAVVLAYLGFGALSFVLPLPVLSLIEWGMGWWYVRQRPWRARPEPRAWWPLFRDTRWVLAGTLGVAGVNLGSNMVIGFFVPTAVVGVFFFAFQIVVQVGVLVSANILQVLAPALSKIAEDLDRKRAATERCLRQVMLLGAPMCLGLVATFTPLELFIWKGKWADASDAVLFIGALYPASLAAAVSQAVMQARGQFRRWGMALIVMAALTLLSAAIGAMVDGTPGGIALYASLGNAIAALGVTIAGVGEIGIGPGNMLQDIAPPWLLAVAAAAIAMIIDRHVLGGAGGQPGGSSRLAAFVRTGIAGGVFTVAYAVLTRALLPRYLREAIAVVPQRWRPLASAALRFR
jgi:O-antigen/teichoic acid export membrane protein